MAPILERYKTIRSIKPIEDIKMHKIRFGYQDHVMSFFNGVYYLHVMAVYKYAKEDRYLTFRQLINQKH